ncbi:MAG: phage holin family protein [Oscillospiraceae bacterium]|nr:phage holin family protein [Oscillospiraceae bacterium]
MTNFKMYFKLICTMLVSFFEYLVGGFDNSIKTLLAFMIADVITGLRKAYMGKSEKSSKGYLDSQVMQEGGIRKILVFVVIYVATVTGQLVNPDSPIIRNLTISYYIATEALSVLENTAICGIKLPKPLIDALENLKNEDTT